MKVKFIDESGDHNLDPDKVDPAYPLFVLCGCIFDEKYYEKEVIKKFNQFKIDFFGSDDIILHYLEMTRPSKAKDERFLKFKDPDFRLKFYKALNIFLEETDFALVACVIKKQSHLEKYGVSALDPYLLSFDTLINEFAFSLDGNEHGKLFVERRNSVLDNQLELAWINAKINGTKQITGAELKEKIENLFMTPKSQNVPGLQIADLVATPIGRHILGLKRKVAGNEVRYEILKKKLKGRKLTILPS